MRKIVLGSRGSQLALRQSKILARDLETLHPDLEVSIEVIRTTGDKIPHTALSKLAAGVKGLFVKEIEEALLEQRIDVAVHSLKDLPTELPEGLTLAAIPQREDARDGLVTESPEIQSFEELPQKARVGTGSLRRRVQLQLLRRDLVVSAIRGNVDTRIRKIRERNLDAIVLAAAGLRRLGLEEKISYLFSVEEMIPAIGQGALGVETRADDESTLQLVKPLDDLPTRHCALAERRFLQEMGGGCDVPMGAHASLENGNAHFTAFVADPASLEVVKRVCQGQPQDLERLAVETAQYLISQGGDQMLKDSAIQNLS